MKYKVFLGLLAIFFLIHVLQSLTHFYIETGLKGDIHKTEIDSVSLNFWLNTKLQDNTAEYIKENIGFYNFYIRLRNQIDFSFFNKSSAKKVVIGKNNILFEDGYINSTMGKGYVGDKFVQSKAKTLKMLQDSLESNGITLIFVFAPGKGTYYNEFIPDRFIVKNVINTNYLAYSKAVINSGVNVIDINSWFLSLKPSFGTILMPKNGIHWSIYGSYLAADSILKKVSTIRNCEMPTLELDWNNSNNDIRENDQDILGAMNLLYYRNDDSLRYPNYKWNSSINQNKLKILSIGDSFYWNLYNICFSDDIFSKHSFFYYNNEFYQKNISTKLKVSDINLKEEILQYDIVLFLITESNLSDLSWGFANQSLLAFQETLVDPSLINFEIEDIQSQIIHIKNDSKLFERIKKESLLSKTSIDSLVKKQALQQLREITIFKTINKKIFERMLKIKENKEWLSKIKEKAIKNNRLVEEQILVDVKWLLNKE